MILQCKFPCDDNIVIWCKARVSLRAAPSASLTAAPNASLRAPPTFLKRYPCVFVGFRRTFAMVRYASPSPRISLPRGYCCVITINIYMYIIYMHIYIYVYLCKYVFIFKYNMCSMYSMYCM